MIIDTFVSFMSRSFFAAIWLVVWSSDEALIGWKRSRDGQVLHQKQEDPLFLSLSTHTHTHTISLSSSLSCTNKHTHTKKNSLSLFSLSLKHTHILSFSLTHTLFWPKNSHLSSERLGQITSFITLKRAFARKSKSVKWRFWTDKSRSFLR